MFSYFAHLAARQVPLALDVCLAFAGSVYLVERRGRKERLDPTRHMEITTILEGIPEAALVADARGRIVEANQAAALLTGKSREDLCRGTLGALTRTIARSEQSLELLRPIFSRVMQGDVVRLERRVLRHPLTGSTVEVLVSANPIRNAQGEVIGALLIARDVTELAHLQRRIGDIERHHAIGQMAAALAHDFNNVLGAIGQAATLLQSGAQDENERKSLLDIIQQSVRRGAEIIGRIREYLRTGKSALGPVEVCQVLEETVQLTRPLWQRAGIRIEKKLERAPSVCANAADLRRVFTNLIINAIEAMPKGGTISVQCRQQHDKVMVEVADTGQGIPEDQKKNIFYPYYTTKAGGTGLGLSGAQKIVLAEGGTISFESEQGRGTRFRLEWPVASSGDNEGARAENGARNFKRDENNADNSNGRKAA